MKNIIFSEIIKMKNSYYWITHILAIITGFLLLIGYFAIYRNTLDITKNINFMMELISLVLPIIISIIIELNTKLEINASNFFRILSYKNRISILLSKLIIFMLSFFISLLILMVTIIAGILIFSLYTNIPIILFFKVAIFLFLCNIITYIFHLFLNYRFGLGCSLFFGIFEVIEIIVCSNIQLKGIWQYILFPSWGIKLGQEIIKNTANLNYFKITIILILTIIALLAFCTWFSIWSGKKSYD